MLFSFYLTYVFLITTGVVTFIEALRAKNDIVRHIMNLETCISIVAAFFYSLFVKSIEKESIDYDEINKLRYVDWAITTPIMLFVLCMVLAYEKKTDFTISVFFTIMLLDFAMLGIGYLGEIEQIKREWGLIGGFVFFCIMYWFIWIHYGDTGTFVGALTFWVFVAVWAFYGIAYMLPVETKNIAYNGLDLVAKCFVGLFFWMYYSRSVVFK